MSSAVTTHRTGGTTGTGTGAAGGHHPQLVAGSITALDAFPGAAGVVGEDLDVPLVQGGSTRHANLDYAASAPPLESVTAHLAQALPYYASVHRGAGYTSQVSSALYEGSRAEIAAFVGARDDDLTILCRNTTDALNLLASAVPAGQQVACLDVEHHANLLPWQQRGATIVPAADTVSETLERLDHVLAEQPIDLLAITGASNVTGELLPLDQLAGIAHRHGARLAVDGAQLVPHRRIDIAASGVDYLAFSGHKCYAPYGAGVLVGRADWLNAADPYLAGGGAVRKVTTDSVQWATGPARHEAGTPNVLGAAALASACRTIAELGEGPIRRHESRLRTRLLSRLISIPGVRALSIWSDTRDAVGVVGFTVAGYPAGLVAAYLSAEHGIGVRDGAFCAHPLLDRLDAGDGAIRASFGLGTRSEDIDRLVAALWNLTNHGPSWSYARVDGRYQPTPDPRPAPSWLDDHRDQTAATSPCQASAD